MKRLTISTENTNMLRLTLTFIVLIRGIMKLLMLMQMVINFGIRNIL